MSDFKERPDTGLACLQILAQLHEVAADGAQLRHQFGTNPFDVTRLLLAAKSLGLTAKAVSQDVLRIDKAALPAIAPLLDGRFMVVARFQAGQTNVEPRVLVQLPGDPPQVLSLQELQAQWTGELIFLTSKATYAGDTAKFDFT